ncbi:sugar kinase [Mycolicibacterium sp. S2-37]|uniref:sugar kinase n=1 Tax=Mycolicibacterium sp. S2-37 TaxID=2810297 RepID=UPI001A9515D3|nr:sugar kinase [Mycolicibacterium sp. S2-37]MBO0678487.1 sugar kinase [Mycolicibacterium sp. S2-37]
MSAPDVIVLGEPMLELSAGEPLETATDFRVSFSGDALNAAAASASAGARTALLTRVSDDEIGSRLLRYAAHLGVDTSLVRRGPTHTGAYLVGADPAGEREFVYLRSGSAATMITPADLADAPLDRTRVLLASGISMALSEGVAATVLEAARRVSAAGGAVVYDPNYRRRLVDTESAREHLRRLAPLVTVAVPSCPADTEALLDTADPQTAARRLIALGAQSVVVTRGSEGVLMVDGDTVVELAAIPAPRVHDATGAGDVFAGTVAAGLARGPLSVELVRTAAAAAALSLAGQGGTGRLATAEEVRAYLLSASG